MRPTTKVSALVLAAAIDMTLPGCSGGSSSSAAPACVPGLTPSCAATYAPPAFPTIFANILQPNCATGMGTCHTSDYGAGGLVFADQTTSYQLLLGTNTGVAYVIPGNPGCSTLMERLESTDPSYHMPRGPNFLSDGDLCTIVQWIAGGATP